MRTSVRRICSVLAALALLATPGVALRAGEAPGAVWRIGAMGFAGDYPRGFSFTLEAASSAGRIVAAVVMWRHAPGQVYRAWGHETAPGVFSATWQAGRRTGVPGGIGVEYWWRVQDEAGHVHETPRQFAEYLDTTREWRRAESEDGLVIWQEGVPDAVGALTLAALREAREQFRAHFGAALPFRPRYIIYADHRPFEEWLPGAGGVMSGGFTTVAFNGWHWGGTVHVYRPAAGPEGVAYGTVLHETAHLYQQAAGVRLSVADACWFIEGHATFFERAQEYDYLARVRALAAAGRLPTFAQVGAGCRAVHTVRDAYDIGYAFFVWLEATFGPGVHRPLWALLGDGAPLNDALQAVTGRTFAALEADFRAWLGG
jgi:hypothetical protein